MLLTQEEIKIATDTYEALSQKLTAIKIFSELIDIVGLDLINNKEVEEYKDWFLNNHYPKSLKAHKEYQQRYGDELNEIGQIGEKFLNLFAETIKRIKE